MRTIRKSGLWLLGSIALVSSAPAIAAMTGYVKIPDIKGESRGSSAQATYLTFKMERVLITSHQSGTSASDDRHRQWIDVLIGQMTPKVRERGHDALPTFGVGRDRPKAEWQAIFRQMLGHDLLRPDPERQGALRMTEAARPILRAEASITLRRDTIRVPSGPVVRALVSDEDAPLLSALKAKRRALAEAARVPAYVIFPDRTLIEMAERRPATLDDMARVGGVGAKKLESFGLTFLEVITGASDPAPHPARMRLAGRAEGTVLDRLLAIQRDLARGADGTGKFLSCTHNTLARIAEQRPRTRAEMERIGGMGTQKADRFAEAFLAVLQED